MARARWLGGTAWSQDLYQRSLIETAMALATQCPHCHTSFRVANDQLKLHAGLVRCGQCQQTFDGIAHLLGPDGLPQKAATERLNAAENTAAITIVAVENSTSNTVELLNSEAHDEALVPTALGFEPVAELPTELATETSITSLDFDLADDSDNSDNSGDKDRQWNQHAKEAEQLALQTRSALSHEDSPEWSRKEPNFSETSSTSEISETTALHQVADEVATSQPSIEPESEPEQETDESDDESKSEAEESPDPEAEVSQEHQIAQESEDEKPNFVLQAERKQRSAKWQRIGFSLLVLILLLAALGQGVYFFRVMIAAHFPSTKVHLLKICEKLKCQIKLPAQKEALEISGKELQNESPELYLQVLTVQIQNNSNTIQAWPMLELILKDGRQKVLLQRAFAPSEYLEDKTLVAQGIPATSEQNIKVYFENTSVKAANFTVDLFYP